MKYRRVSKIDHEFSLIGFGCWGASGGGSWTNHSDEEEIKAIRKAIDLGVNFFDVAPVYGLGHAEEVLGRAIKGHRHKIFIATKTGLPWDESFNVRNDVTKDNILKEIDDSLTRLGVDYVDLYQVHWPSDSGVALEETMAAMKLIKESGKARYIGLSNYSVNDAKKMSEYGELSSMQGLFNMLEQKASHYHNIPLQYRTSDEVLPYVKEEGMAFFPYSPLFQGLLTGKISKDTVFASKDVRKANPKLHGKDRMKHIQVLEEIRNMDELKDRPLNEIAFNYLIAKNEVTSVIASVMNEKEVVANIKSLEWDMSQDTLDKLEALVTNKFYLAKGIEDDD